MTSKKEIVSFEQRVEQHNFVLNDQMLKHLLLTKISRLQEQLENNKKIYQLITQTK